MVSQLQCILDEALFLSFVILVAVKELFLQQDVLHEENMLIRLCHPYLPYLLGICTSARPLRSWHWLKYYYFISRTARTKAFFLHEAMGF